MVVPQPSFLTACPSQFQFLADRQCRRSYCSTWASRKVATACMARTLREAISKGYVLDFGRTIQIDSDGRFPLRNDLRLPEDLQDSMQIVVKALLMSLCVNNMQAVYIRGSVATGNVLPDGKSDLDLVVVTHTLPTVQKQRAVVLSVSALAEKILGLTGADIRFITSEKTHHPCGEGNISVLIQNYSVCVYQSENCALLPHVQCRITDDQALNIRHHERIFLRVIQEGRSRHDWQMQVNAIKWICKRCLRAIADLSAFETLRHSRDLVPCFKLGVEAFPEFEESMLLTLQVACASFENPVRGPCMQDFVKRGFDVSRCMVEVVEELALRRKFATYELCTKSLVMASAAVVSPQSMLRQALPSIRERFCRVRRKFRDKSRDIRPRKFFRSKLPQVLLNPKLCANTIRINNDGRREGEHTNLTRFLSKVSSPTVFRNAVPISDTSTRSGSTAHILESIVNSNFVLQCRVSPTQEFTFSRGSHPWVEACTYSPPSVAVSVPSEEAIERLSEGCQSSPLHYVDVPREFLYVQTAANPSAQFFRGLDSCDLQVAQNERIWISTHGSVSTLHYDASHSVLLQRTGAKRMIFFPPSCLQFMGVYPRGHPLHRRTRIDLSWRESSIFQSFWKLCSHCAVEVILNAGDMIVFPPFWVHHTESWAYGDEELSISHTLRYL